MGVGKAAFAPSCDAAAIAFDPCFIALRDRLVKRAADEGYVALFAVFSLQCEQYRAIGAPSEQAIDVFAAVKGISVDRQQDVAFVKSLTVVCGGSFGSDASDLESLSLVVGVERYAKIGERRLWGLRARRQHAQMARSEFSEHHQEDVIDPFGGDGVGEQFFVAFVGFSPVDAVKSGIIEPAIEPSPRFFEFLGMKGRKVPAAFDLETHRLGFFLFAIQRKELSFGGQKIERMVFAPRHRIRRALMDLDKLLAEEIDGVDALGAAFCGEIESVACGGGQDLIGAFGAGEIIDGAQTKRQPLEVELDTR